jgi:plasmid stability protein
MPISRSRSQRFQCSLTIQVVTMSIVINLPPELEALLRSRAAQQEQDVDLFTSALLVNLFEQEKQEIEDALQGIQQSSEDFEAGRYRSFQEFAEEQRRKYNLPTDS